MIDGTFALNNSGADVALIDTDFSIDSAIWSLVGENLFMDEDSYISKGADFNVYWDPCHGQIHLNQHDGNESWGVSFFGWPGGTTTQLAPEYNFGSNSHPALRRLMAIPALRERYYAHMRTMLEDFSWADLSPQLLGYKALIDAAVQADPKRIYTYAQFQANYNTQTTVLVGRSQRAGTGLGAVPERPSGLPPRAPRPVRGYTGHHRLGPFAPSTRPLVRLSSSRPT